MKYRVDGREKLISFGRYPDVLLKVARERRDEARRLIATNVDPSEKRKAERAATSDTFEAIAREYLQLKSKSLSPRTYDKKLGRFEAFAFPFIGKLPITSIAAPQLLAALRRIEERGNHETARRCERNVAKSSDMPSRLDARSAIQPVTFVARSRRSSSATMPRPLNPLRLVSY